MADVEEVLKMYQAGLTTDSIAMEMDRPINEIRDILTKEGLLLKPGRKSSTEALSEEDRQAIIIEYVDNKTPGVQIIAKYSLTWNAFYKLLDDAGVPYREMKTEDKISRAQRLDRAIQMYEGGARIWEIENETGIRQPVLHNELHKRGKPLRRQAQGPV